MIKESLPTEFKRIDFYIYMKNGETFKTHSETSFHEQLHRYDLVTGDFEDYYKSTRYKDIRELFVLVTSKYTQGPNPEMISLSGSFHKDPYGNNNKQPTLKFLSDNKQFEVHIQDVVKIVSTQPYVFETKGVIFDKIVPLLENKP